jgi:hypothetical protein
MVKLVEFTDHKQENKFDFDIADDAVVFMRNDPMFYRKQYYPAMIELAKLVAAGDKKAARNSILPVVDNGINEYCKRYNLAKQPSDVFKDEDKQNIIKLIFAEEIPNIKKGEYK